MIQLSLSTRVVARSAARFCPTPRSRCDMNSRSMAIAACRYLLGVHAGPMNSSKSVRKSFANCWPSTLRPFLTQRYLGPTPKRE
jgi:hypothetical protein